MANKLNLELSDEAYATLQELQVQLGKSSKAEVLRTGLRLLKFIGNEQRNGHNKGLAIVENGRIDKEILIT